MKVRRNLIEASALGAKADDGTYPIRIITEGEGSTGIYNRVMLEANTEVFGGVASFMNHPIDPNHPERRDVNTIAGRLGLAEYSVDEDGVAGLDSQFKPRAENKELIEEFGDILGLSIFCGATGEMQENGKLLVESFDGNDPYRSVDIVVAAGRGGRFKRAQESLRVIESSLGLPASTTSATSAREQEMEEGNMDLQKVLEAIAALRTELAPVVTFVAESKAAAQTAAVAEADADAIEKAVGEALTGYDEKVRAITEAKLFPSQVEALTADARAGKDIAQAIESAVKVVTEAKASAPAADMISGRSLESADKSDDFTVAGLGI